MQRTCHACGRPYEARSARSMYCTDADCKRARERQRNQRRNSPTADVVELGTAPSVEPDGPNERVTRAELERAGRLNTVAGQNALSIARRLDRAAGDTGSSFAALAKQHLAAVEKALEGAPAVADPIEQRRQAAHQRRLSVVR